MAGSEGALRTDSWQALGFHCAPDHERRAWHFQGSRSGLSRLPRLLIEAGDTLTSGSRLILGPESDVHIRVWERPGIDDETIYGNAEDLRRLAGLIEAELAQAKPGSEFRILSEYAKDAEYGLVVRVMDDDFDVTSATVAAAPSDLLPDSESHDAPVAEADHEQQGVPIAFTFEDPDWELEGGKGLFSITDAEIWLQYQERDEDGETLLPEVHEHVLAFQDIAAVTYKRGILGPIVKIQVYDMRLLEGIKTAQAGSIWLRFKRRYREDVTWSVSYIQSCLSATDL